MEREILLGFEVVQLGTIDEGAPYRMTVDVVVGENVVRYQMIAAKYTKAVRREADLYLAAGFDAEKGAQLDRLDREYADKVQEHALWLLREQVRVLHGDEGVELLERDE